MVESVDTKDLKSFGLNSRAGSSPASSTKKNRKLLITNRLRFSFYEIAPHLHHRMIFLLFLSYIKVLVSDKNYIELTLNYETAIFLRRNLLQREHPRPDRGYQF